MADDAVGSGEVGGGSELAVGIEAPGPDGVDATVARHEAAVRDAALDLITAQPRGEQLPQGGDPMTVAGELGDSPPALTRGDFGAAIALKCPLIGHAVRLALESAPVSPSVQENHGRAVKTRRRAEPRIQPLARPGRRPAPPYARET